MYKQLNHFFTTKSSIAPIFIRLLIGFHLLYGTHDKIFNAEAMQGIGGYFQAIGIPAPGLSAYLSAGAQFLCGICFLIGVLVRPAALVMVFNFFVAIGFAHIGDTYQDMFPALVMLLGSLFLLFNGAGRFSIDKQHWADQQVSG
jgi:putative oxidoreductase